MGFTIRKALSIYQDKGLIQLIRRGCRFMYNQCLRPYTPKRAPTLYNGQRVESVRLLDFLVPWIEYPRPNYESGLVSCLTEHVREGDTVVIIGGGWGVTACVAAKEVGASGRVIVFEGAKANTEKIRTTAQLNGVEDRIKVHHAIVGTAINLRGKARGADQVSPSKLPDCDILELDCEGTEVEILDRLDIRPRRLLVETHGMYDASPSVVQEKLQALSYTLSEDPLVADDGLRQECIENDIYVLNAVRMDDAAVE